MDIDTLPRSTALAGTTNLALIAPVREDGLANGFEPVSHLERLRRLLDAMHASRRNARESELRGSVLPDPVGRHGIITHFRYALVRPGLVSSDRWHLSLNVGFDGGWEPYMRVIYRDLGPLLDALLVHTEGYPGSWKPFDEYCRWVRGAELGGGILYTDSPATLGDQRYLASIERIARETADPAEAADHIARHAEACDADAAATGIEAAARQLGVNLPLHVRTLRGLYRLTPLWSGDDELILRRFAQLVLADFRAAIERDAVRDHPVWSKLRDEVLHDEFAWLGTNIPAPARADRLPWTPTLLQAPLREAIDAACRAPGDPTPPKATHAALLLLRVADPARARAWLAGRAADCAAPTDTGRVGWQIGLTMAGLQALGVHPERLGALPREFADGMESRAGILGDVRGNHPDHWRRPRRHGAAAGTDDRIDLAVVHVAVQLRVVDPGRAEHDLHPAIAARLSDFDAAISGLVLLAVEPTRSRTIGGGRDHFGFADGISQPKVLREHDAARPPDAARDEVRKGELLLGFVNDRGDGPIPARDDTLLDHGSFLVVRKLKQNVHHLNAALAAAFPADPDARQQLLDNMVGRRANGQPLVSRHAGAAADDLNAFDYRGADGFRCPFASHARRANPRDGRPAMPRLLRSGMSYGPGRDEAPADADRGTLFMAYCASIAEQFETVQRWLSGGNSSGVGSAQADPLVGVPRDGAAAGADGSALPLHARADPRVFRWTDGHERPRATALGPNPFVELEWGLYLFVPSRLALERLADFVEAPFSGAAAAARAPDPLDAARARIEDRGNGRATWTRVLAAPGGALDDPDYGRLVGRTGAVYEALADADATRYSVRGFAPVMDATVGLNHLGMDPADGHTDIARIVNAEVAKVGEAQAFDAAWPEAQRQLARLIGVGSLPPFGLQHPDGRPRIAIDLMALSEQVVGALARHWFGLPDGQRMQAAGRLPLPAPPGAAPRCPGSLIGPSRAIFGPHPRAAVMSEALLNGPPVLDATKAMLGDKGAAPGTITGAIRGPLESLEKAQPRLGPDLVAREVAGLLLGFAPTIHGNFLTVMKRWIEQPGAPLWTLQQALAERRLAGDTPYDAAREVLRRAMLDTMQDEPVPPAVWRRPVEGGRPVETAAPGAPPPVVVLGLTAAIGAHRQQHGTGAAAAAERDPLLFGGDHFAAPGSPTRGVHACPGSRMGLGVMLAMATALLEAGTLRPTGSPVLLMLTPKVRPAAPPAPPPAAPGN